MQKIIALFAIEAEYVTVTKANKEMMWLQFFLEILDHKYERSVLHCDSQSVIHLIKNLVYHDRTKHIHVRYHLIRSALENGILTLENIQGNQNLVDMLTKTIAIKELELCTTLVRLLN